MDYLKKVIAHSRADDVDNQMLQPTGNTPVQNITVNVPGSGEERKDGSNTMDDLLAGFEDDLGIDMSMDIGGEESAAIAQEVNLLKQASE